MNGCELKAWRKAGSLTQAAASAVLQIHRVTLAKLEGAPDEQIPESVAAIAHGAAPEPKRVFQVSPASKAAAGRGDPTGVDIGGGLRLRRDVFGHIYGQTPAENRAIREHLAREKGVDLSKVPMLRLKPAWIKVGERNVSAAIPNPVDRAPPEWAGPRGVVTASGEIYDYEGAHVMRNLSVSSVDW